MFPATHRLHQRSCVRAVGASIPGVRCLSGECVRESEDMIRLEFLGPQKASKGFAIGERNSPRIKRHQPDPHPAFRKSPSPGSITLFPPRAASRVRHRARDRLPTYGDRGAPTQSVVGHQRGGDAGAVRIISLTCNADLSTTQGSEIDPAMIPSPGDTPFRLGYCRSVFPCKTSDTFDCPSLHFHR